MSTVRRIQAGILVAVFLVIATCGLVIHTTVRSELVSRVDDQLTAGRRSLDGIAGGMTDTLLSQLAATQQQPDRSSAIVVFGSDGRILLSVTSGVGSKGDPLPDIGGFGIDRLLAQGDEPATLHGIGRSTEFRAVAVEIGDTTLVLATPLDDVNATMRRVSTVMLGSALGAVVILGLVIRAVTRRAIRPVDQMIETAVAIGKGDLTQRISTSSSDSVVARLSEALNDMLHQLEAAFAQREESEHRLRRFVGDASHELRTPLASIRGYAELYLTDAATERGDTDKAMERIHSEALRTASLVDDLLLLARLDQPRELDLEPVDLTRIVTDSVADARAIEPDRSISAVLPDHGITVAGDEAQLRQVLANLLANARSHAPGSAVEVVLSDAAFGITLEVADDGPGLTQDQADHVFDRFWRADEARSRGTGGSGLGLSITAAVVTAHGGTISVHTAPGQGARFRVHLPA